MHLKDIAKTPLRAIRNSAARCVQALPISSETLGPPKDDDNDFGDYLKRESRWVSASRETVIHPSEATHLPPADGIFGPCESGFLREEIYMSVPATIYECPDARIYNRPHAIISPDDRLFAFASAWYSPRRRSHFAFQSLSLGPVEKLSGKTLYFGGSNNVWHLFTDTLRQIHLLEKTGMRLEEFDHIVAKAPETPVERWLYAVLGMGGERLIYSDAFQHLKCEHLTFFHNPSHRHGSWEPNVVRDLVFRLLGISPLPAGSRRLYISRSRAAMRRVANEKEIFSLLEARGFEVLHLESMTPRDQVTAFRDAKIVIGPHGAGLTHFMFSSPNAALIELRNSDFRRIDGSSESYRIFSGLLQQRYFTVTTRDIVNPKDSKCSDLRFDPALVQEAYEGAERAMNESKTESVTEGERS